MYTNILSLNDYTNYWTNILYLFMWEKILFVNVQNSCVQNNWNGIFIFKNKFINLMRKTWIPNNSNLLIISICTIVWNQHTTDTKIQNWTHYHRTSDIYNILHDIIQYLHQMSDVQRTKTPMKYIIWTALRERKPISTTSERQTTTFCSINYIFQV